MLFNLLLLISLACIYCLPLIDAKVNHGRLNSLFCSVHFTATNRFQRGTTAAIVFKDDGDLAQWRAENGTLRQSDA